ncbi:MAG TPA: hypothetical protein VLE69_00750 [Candidatus Saccharimonadales bacterium]|nr:hypothetical protein [Candidatus Saccharimonadales bacterium]
MIKLNSKGLGVIEVILVVVIVGLIGGVGYFVYQSKKNTDQILNNTANSQGTPEKSTKTSTKPTTPSNTVTTTNTDPNYLIIKEWGVKVKIPNANRLSYEIVSQSGDGTTPDGSAEYVDTARLSLADSITTDTSCKSIGIGIGRAKLIKSTSSLPTVGNYVFEVGGSPYACGNAQLDAIRATYTGNNPSSWTYSAN